MAQEFNEFISSKWPILKDKYIREMQILSQEGYKEELIGDQILKNSLLLKLLPML